MVSPRTTKSSAKRGIDVKGKIAIARYGGSWRGIKPKVAAEHGAVGCIIYSDPRNDGFYQGDVYPKGAWRNDNGVQRGSVMDMPLYPGDPLTPGVGATKDAKRLAMKDAKTLTKIPVLPISYADALPLLKNMDGAVVPEAWRGALPLTYHFGGGSPTVHLKLEFNWDTKTLYDVIAKLPGSERPDEWVIRGNHHDAWVNGADDPLSGQVAMLEEARSVSELVKTGWKPKRTIVYCAWDGEEEGLLGSTEWVETHASELSQKAVVYINSDTNGRGFLGVGGSHTLEKFVNEVARDIADPQTKISVWERARAQQVVDGSPTARREAMDRSDTRIYALGSGSDYTPFLQHLGIASLNIGFGGEDSGGSYHSIYDSFDHYSRFGDPNFAYGVALAKVGGHMTLRFANAETVPFDFANFAETVNGYVNEVMRLTDSMREETRSNNQIIANGMLKAVQDPTATFIVPSQKEEVPFLNFSPLQNAMAKLNESVKRYQKAPAGKQISPQTQRSLDEILFKTERTLTRNEGLPRRDWFRHQIYAPGFYTGYGVKTLPSIRERSSNETGKKRQNRSSWLQPSSTDLRPRLIEPRLFIARERMSELTATTEGSTRYLTLNRPEKRNALNDVLIGSLKDELWAADTDVRLRAVVIRGAGKDFCSGADLSTLQKTRESSYEENLEDAKSLAELFSIMRSVKIPVIAAVHGRALAGGCGLATGCDLVLAARSARFGYPEVKIGFVPAIVTAILRRNVSEKVAFELITQGKEFSAEQALAFGLINQVFEDGTFEMDVNDYVSVYKNVSRSAVMLSKRLLYRMDGMDFDQALEAGAIANAEARMTDDLKQGIARFLDKT
jgi:N-acetylated-alpha-linked acidic dipeptidase